MAKRAYSPREILKMTYKPIPWGGEWERCFGQPDMYDTWFISGPSAGGKSSFVMQLAKKLCEYGIVLYCSFEEKVSMSFKERISVSTWRKSKASSESVSIQISTI